MNRIRAHYTCCIIRVDSRSTMCQHVRHSDHTAHFFHYTLHPSLFHCRIKIQTFHKLPSSQHTPSCCCSSIIFTFMYVILIFPVRGSDYLLECWICDFLYDFAAVSASCVPLLFIFKLAEFVQWCQQGQRPRKIYGWPLKKSHIMQQGVWVWPRPRPRSSHDHW